MAGKNFKQIGCALTEIMVPKVSTIKLFSIAGNVKVCQIFRGVKLSAYIFLKCYYIDKLTQTYIYVWYQSLQI